jgi:glycosyltransferase involved in cell wall biosynthesis
MKPMVSVVLPMFNEASNVDRVLAGVFAELESQDVICEVVCVNDGSTDATGEALAGIARHDDRVVPVHLSSRGATAPAAPTARGSRSSCSRWRPTACW